MQEVLLNLHFGVMVCHLTLAYHALPYIKANYISVIELEAENASGIVGSAGLEWSM